MVVVVSNPVSGRNKRDPRIIPALDAVLAADPTVPSRHLKPVSPEGLDDLARELRAEPHLAAVCVNGGDGTLAHVLSALARTWDGDPLPPIGILRGGTMNTVAHGIGLTGRPAGILGRILARQAQGQPQPTVNRHLMRIRDGLGLDRYGFLFGNGVISNFLEAYYEGGHASPTKGARILARAVVSAVVGGAFARRLTRPTRVRASLDGHRWTPDAYMAVAAGTVDDMGLGFKPFWAVTGHPGQLQALGFACSPFALAVRIPGTQVSRPWGHPAIVDLLGARLVLTADEPIAYMIEGDFHRGGQQVEVEVGPPVPLVHR